MCSPPGGSSCIREDLEYEAKGTEALPTGGWLLVGVWSCVANDTLSDVQSREAMAPRLLQKVGRPTYDSWCVPPSQMSPIHILLGSLFGPGNGGASDAGSEVCNESAGLGGLSEMSSLGLSTLVLIRKVILKESGLFQLSLGQVLAEALNALYMKTPQGGHTSVSCQADSPGLSPSVHSSLSLMSLKDHRAWESRPHS